LLYSLLYLFYNILMYNNGRNKVNLNVKMKSFANAHGKSPVPVMNKSSYFDKDIKIEKSRDQLRGNSHVNMNYVQNESERERSNLLKKSTGGFPIVSEHKVLNPSGSGSNLLNKINLRKDVIRLYEKNYKKFKSDFNLNATNSGHHISKSKITFTFTYLYLNI
jgi:hypothetical protein